MEEQGVFLKIVEAARRNRKNLGVTEQRENCGCGMQDIAVSLHGGTEILVKTSLRSCCLFATDNWDPCQSSWMGTSIKVKPAIGRIYISRDLETPRPGLRAHSGEKPSCDFPDLCSLLITWLATHEVYNLIIYK